MHCTVNIFLTYFLIKGCVPLGFKIESVRDARRYEYPFIVRLESRVVLIFGDRIFSENNIHICTCVALSPSWTLTAGHCIDSAGPVKDDFNNLQIQTVIRYRSGSSSSTAEVISSVLHPNYNDPVLKMQSDIGLLRTEAIRLKKFADISSIDVNSLGGHEVTLAGHIKITPSLKIEGNNVSIQSTSLQLMTLLVVRYDSTDYVSPRCVSKRCVLSSSSTLCDEESGGPLLHYTGVIGVNTMSLKNFQLCSEDNLNGRVGMEVITWTKLHIKWINENIRRDPMSLSN